MKPEIREALHNLCQDEIAFEQLQQIIGQEFESVEQELCQKNLQIKQQNLLQQVIHRIRATLDLPTIFQATASEVRQLLGVDRVGMFRFFADSHGDDGEFVSEDVNPAFRSALAQKIHDHCFGDQYAVHYEQGRIQAVADIYDASMSPCHIEVLAQFQVRANLVVPLLQGTKLWGLLCIHHCQEPRPWQPIEIEFVSQIASQLGVALQQAELLAELRAEIFERQQAEERVKGLNQGLRQAILELKAVNRELEAFSYAVSHDLRAPLRSIDGFSQALLEDCIDELDPNGQDYLRRIRAATQRMGQLIDDMLTLSRVTRSDIQIVDVDLSLVCRRIYEDLRQSQPDRLIELVSPPVLIAQGDPHLLQIVLENLIHNAWKFTSQKPQSRIEVGVVESTKPAVYFVRDDGVGFDMNYVDKLFAPFQRLHRMQEFPGNGIGLATVQRIIHRHGGRVWAEGCTHQGATFFFTLAEEESEE